MRAFRTLALLTAALAAPPAAHAAIFPVDATHDAVDAAPGDGLCATAEGACTLRAAVMEANALPGADEVVLGAGAYELTVEGAEEDAAATGDLDLIDDIHILGAGAESTLVRADVVDRVFHVNSGIAALEGLAITGGRIDPPYATTAKGGGILVDLNGYLNIRRAWIYGNVAGSGEVCGPIFCSDIPGRGGGIYALGSLTVFQSTININIASSRGPGGGIYAEGASLQIDNSTLSVNESDSDLFISGGSAHLDSITIEPFTVGISAGSGSGSPVVTLANSILARPACSAGSGAAMDSAGYNLTEDASCGLSGLNDLVADPMLAPLAWKGGHTRTHALYPGSPAIDSGDPACSTEDQRSAVRPQDGDGNGKAGCDRGAFEKCSDADTDGFSTLGGACGPADCNDLDAWISPNVTETCNGVDDNCDGLIDETTPLPALLRFDGVAETDALGDSVAGLGDINVDQFSDVAVGASSDDASGLDSGAVHVYSGLNGAPLYSLFGVNPGDRFGNALGVIGDLDLDGVADFVVGALIGNYAQVFSGQTGSLVATLYGDNVGDRFGVSVAGAGDVDADGFPDIIIGAHESDENGTSSGSARVVSGGGGATLYLFVGDAPLDKFGYSVFGAGDVDGDSFDDVIVGAREGNYAHVLSGSSGAQIHSFFGEADEDQFGFAVSGLGDVNGDGLDDLLVGARLNDFNGKDSGSAYVFSGASGATIYALRGDEAGDFFGDTVSGLGDVDQDGKPDMAVGATHADRDNDKDRGLVRIFSGATGTEIAVIEGDSAGDEMGSAIADAGDTDGDGVADILLGAWRASLLAAFGGSARVVSIGERQCPPGGCAPVAIHPAGVESDHPLGLAAARTLALLIGIAAFVPRRRPSPRN